MKLSTRSRYGVRFMIFLAVHSGSQAVQLKQVCEEEGISEKYLSQIVILLRNIGLIKSIRGAQGGYLLARSPGEISLAEIVECLEGSLFPVECDEEGGCDRITHCVANEVWCELGRRIRGYLESLNLEKMKKLYLDKNGNGFSYMI